MTDPSPSSSLRLRTHAGGAADLAELLPGGTIWISGAASESAILAAMVDALDDRVDRSFTGIFLPGINQRVYLPGAARMTAFFLTPEMRAAGDRVEFLPLCYQDIGAHLRRHPIAAALFMASPPDANGLCSLGPNVDFLADLWRDIPVRIAHINPALPRTPGDRGIPFDSLTAFVEADEPLFESTDSGADAVSQAVAGHVAAFIGDGATLQTGLGRLPDTVLRTVSDRRNLRVFGGLIGNGVLDLLSAGALAPGPAITTGVAIGSRALYDAISGDRFRFAPPSFTHDAGRIAAQPGLVTLNGALEVDLFGQAYAEFSARGLLSGPGGAGDFARGARIGGGLRILALPATHGRQRMSTIVAPPRATGLVSLGRQDIDIVATEHGSADLRALSHERRAAALIAIAAPEHRDALAADWMELRRRM